MKDFHQPVLPEEVIHYLDPKPGQKFIDCTLGGGGHAIELLSKTAPDGMVLGIDLDPIAIKTAQKAVKQYAHRIIFVKDNFRNLKDIVKERAFGKANGILLDLGLSSGQLQDHSRGFSFLAEGRLDMRFGQQTELTAEKILNTFSEKELIEILRSYAEERLARPIALTIIEHRKIKPIVKPEDIIGIVADVYKKYFRGKSKVNPATKIFQALRIAVNRELDNLQTVLPQAIGSLKPGGRLAVISYHSLEDRIVKDYFRQESRDCLCPPSMPLCQCGHHKSIALITHKPVEPTFEEVAQNPRSRSAKLRVIEKLK
jgi:16S rRNA (cytosine1402-N4)-methyltransferase